MTAAAESLGNGNVRIPPPIRRMAFASAFSLAVMAGLGVYDWSASQTFASVLAKEFRAMELLRIAGSAAENRTASARIAVATADARWRSRYVSAKGAWELSIAELRRVAPAALESKMGVAMEKSAAHLQELESRAFDFAKRGRSEGDSMLFGDEYEEEETAQRHSEQKIATLLQRDLQRALDRQHSRATFETTLFWIVFPLPLGISILSLRGAIRHFDERRRIEQRLEESEQRLTTLFEGVDDALLVHAMDGRFIDCNPAACRRLGYAREELLDLKTTDIDAPEFAQGFAQSGARQMAADGYVCEGEHIARGGRRIPVEVNTRVITYRGEPAVLASIRDITERKRAEAELELMREAADAANCAKSEFLANMSHEIRTPMNGILGMTELALGANLTGEQREYLEMIKSSADSLLKVINDILDFSKIEAGKLLMEPIEFDLREALADTMRTLAFRAQEKGLDLAYRVPPNVPARLVGDAGRLQQVIVNLVGNAIKFTERGEIVITVSLSSREVSSAVLRFAIADTGIGIPENRLGDIFEPFLQGDGSTTRKYGGTGLGLAISAQLARLMGGHIWAESEAGKGSVFHFTAQFGAPPVEAPDRAPAARGLEGLTALVVDESATSRNILHEMLSGWELKTALKASVKDALEALRAEDAGSFPIVVLDAKTILAAEPGQTARLAEGLRLPTPPGGPLTILLTPAAHGEQETLSVFGARACLHKPVRQSELFDALMTLVAADSLERLNAFRAKGQPPAAEPAPPGNPPHRTLRILVAEDNLINQRVLVKMLEKPGHSVTLVANGREAVEILARQSFDLALLDVQMPEMSGLEAVAIIRAKEKASGSSRLPIVAITANAMKGDREQCLAAGMDGYIAKPIRQEELFVMIEKMVIIQKPEPAISFDGALFDGDPEFLAEIVNLFLETYPSMLSDIDDAVSRLDAPALRRAAHTMKGAVANFGAKAIVEQTMALEAIGGSENLATAAAAANALRSLLAGLVPELKTAVSKVGDNQVYT